MVFWPDKFIFPRFLCRSLQVVFCCFCYRYSMTKAFCIAFLMTFFSVFDVPVFWPILLCYWIVLFVLTMRRQIAHMIKYKYIPFNVGKQVSSTYLSSVFPLFTYSVTIIVLVNNLVIQLICRNMEVRNLLQAAVDIVEIKAQHASE